MARRIASLLLMLTLAGVASSDQLRGTVRQQPQAWDRDLQDRVFQEDEETPRPAPEDISPNTITLDTEAPTEALESLGETTESPEPDVVEPIGAGTEGPGPDVQETDAPGTDAPGTDAPGTDAPGTDAPGTDAPGTDAPETEVPGTDAPLLVTDAPLIVTDAPLPTTPPPVPAEEPQIVVPVPETAAPSEAPISTLAPTESTRLEEPMVENDLAPADAETDEEEPPQFVVPGATPPPPTPEEEEEEEGDDNVVVDTPTYQVQSSIEIKYFAGKGKEAKDSDVELFTGEARKLYSKKLKECFAEKFDKVQNVGATSAYDSVTGTLMIHFKIAVQFSDATDLTEHAVAQCISAADWNMIIKKYQAKGENGIEGFALTMTGKGRRLR